MTHDQKRPLAQRALMRGGLVFAAVMSVYGLLALFGVETASGPARVLVAALIGGAAWGAFYYFTASAVERTIARIEAEAEQRD